MSYLIKLPLACPAPLASLRHPTPVIWELEVDCGVHDRLSQEVIEEVFLK